MFINVVYCSGGYMLCRGVACCSGRLYAVQEGYMDVLEGYMVKKIMICIVATNFVASWLPKCRQTCNLAHRINSQN